MWAKDAATHRAYLARTCTVEWLQYLKAEQPFAHIRGLSNPFKLDPRFHSVTLGYHLYAHIRGLKTKEPF